MACFRLARDISLLSAFISNRQRAAVVFSSSFLSRSHCSPCTCRHAVLISLRQASLKRTTKEHLLAVGRLIVPSSLNLAQSIRAMKTRKELKIPSLRLPRWSIKLDYLSTNKFLNRRLERSQGFVVTFDILTSDVFTCQENHIVDRFPSSFSS
jgi:hypothetical protein